jgi:4-amino-4-deoxy-L-arabinose transferase-like glycosyltransferase
MRAHITKILTKVCKWSQQNKGVVLLILIMAFLRLVNFQSHVTFLGDQGRDAIIMKRIITFEHFPAIGAPTSIGQIYLGPFYYYFMAPWLLIAGFNPVGLALGVAVLSLGFGFWAFWLVSKKYGTISGLIFFYLLVFSAANISLSRFSWNPNLLPIFTFFTLLFFEKTLTERKLFPALIFGALFSFSFQLHYLSVFLFPTFLIFLILSFLKEPKAIWTSLVTIGAAIVSFAFFSLPLLIYDLRHEFLNSRNFLKLMSEGGTSGIGNFWGKLTESISHLWLNVFQVSVSPTLSLGILFLIVIAAFLVKSKQKERFFYINLVSLLVFILGFSFLNSGRFEHYYTPIYYSLFLVMAVIMGIRLKRCQICRWLIAGFCLFYAFGNFNKFKVIFSPGGNQIAEAQKVAQFLSPKIGNRPFNFATWPVAFSEDNYLYFLELTGRKVADRRKIEITQQLFVVCETAHCPVLNSPSWNISMFGKARIAKMWKTKSIKIFKLLHAKE